MDRKAYPWVACAVQANALPAFAAAWQENQFPELWRVGGACMPPTLQAFWVQSQLFTRHSRLPARVGGQGRPGGAARRWAVSHQTTGGKPLPKFPGVGKPCWTAIPSFQKKSCRKELGAITSG